MRKNKHKIIVTLLLVSALFLTTNISIVSASSGRQNKHYKNYNRHNKHYRHHKNYKHHSHYKNRRYYPYYNRHISWPEFIAKAVIIGGLEYYYQQGQFYRRGRGGYIVADPPLGAVVKRIPRGYKVFRLNKRKYYHYNDVYYVKKPRGYVVVEDPLYYEAKLPGKIHIINNSQRSQLKDYEYMVNISNSNGTFTPVRIIQARDGGYVGPQGEYYQGFPKVAQLQIMYGK